MAYATAPLHTGFSEEEAEYEHAKLMAKRFSEAAENWQTTLSQAATPTNVACWVLSVALGTYFCGELLGTFLALAWAATQLVLGFRPSCCRTAGTIAMGLALLGGAVKPLSLIHI